MLGEEKTVSDFNSPVDFRNSFLSSTRKGVTDVHRQMILSQLLDYHPKHEFDKCVRKYQGSHRIGGFSCLDQFLCMAFAQLTHRESLRDIESCVRAMHNKIHHMGIRGCISRSTLADANES